MLYYQKHLYCKRRVNFQPVIMSYDYTIYTLDFFELPLPLFILKYTSDTYYTESAYIHTKQYLSNRMAM